MTVKRRDFQKIATTLLQFLLKLTDTYECAELRDSLNMSLLQLQKYYRKCQQRLQHTGKHSNDQNSSGYVSPRQSLRITLSRSSEAMSPMTPYIEEPQYFHAHWTELHEKADQIRKSLIQENLNYHMSINTPPMHYAATKADFEMLNDLYKEKKDILVDQDCLGRTPLMYAVYFDQVEVVRWLLKRGADPNSYDFNEVTSLHWASYKGNVTLIELLLDAGANINFQDSFGRSACHWACTCDSVEPLQLLIEFDTKVNQHDRNGLTPAMWACRLDHLLHLNILSKVKNQEPDHIDGYDRDRNGRTIIHWSIRRQQPHECFKHLLNEQSIQLKDDEGKTVLLLAAEQGALETCKIIIEKFGSKYIDDVDDNDKTSLILATGGGHGEVVNYLLENGAKLKAKDKSGASCIDIARNQYLFYCQLIISSHIRESEKRCESVPSDCVELIEKVNSRQSSVNESRPFVKTPPRPPTSPKSPSSQRSKSPSKKNRVIKSTAEQNDEEIPNGFDAMSSDSCKAVYEVSEKNKNQCNYNQQNFTQQSTLSRSYDNIQYQEPETVDFLNNDTGQQYHGSYENLKIQQSENNQKPVNYRDTFENSSEQNPKPIPFQRAKKSNKISSNVPNLISSPSPENQPQAMNDDVTNEEEYNFNSTNVYNRSNSNHSTTTDIQPKINYGASLEPISKHFSNQPAFRKKKKKNKEPRTRIKSQERLENFNYNRDRPQDFEFLSNTKSLESIPNKLVQLPNGMMSKRLSAASDISSRDKIYHGTLIGERRKTKLENVLDKSPSRVISSQKTDPNWFRNGTT